MLPFLRTFFLTFVILENLFENVKGHNSKTEQVMVLGKAGDQLLCCINNINNDEEIQEQGILVRGPEYVLESLTQLWKKEKIHVMSHDCVPLVPSPCASPSTSGALAHPVHKKLL